jgi:hypothetical protein
MIAHYIVTTAGRTYIRRDGESKYRNIKNGNVLSANTKRDDTLYIGTNKISAEYIAVKAHYDRCVNRGESNEYGLSMLIMDIKYYEDRYPEFCI